MLIISVKDNNNNRWKTNTKKQRQNKTKQQKTETRGVEAIAKGWEMILLSIKLAFLQLICKASLIFKSNLELALSIILKERELYESKHVAVECRCLKIWDLLSFLICSQS